MYEALLDRSLRSIEAVKRHIDASSAIRTLISQKGILCKETISCFDLKPFYERAPNSTDWRIIDHCSAVTRLYAIYEQFVEELLGEFLVFLENAISYSDLDVMFRAEHRRMLGQLISQLDRERYRSLRFETIITDLAGAFEKSGKYRILPEAMLAHDQNLRMSELASLFNRCRIKDSKIWLVRHRAVKTFFVDQTRQSDRFEAELKQLVDYRNDAAHGGIEIDSVVGPDILVEYADFLGALFAALAECVQWWVIEISREHGVIQLAGKVTELFKNNIVVAIIENAKVSVGDRVYVRGEFYCYPVKILSIQMEGVDVKTQTVLRPTEVGLKFDLTVRKSGELYYVNFDAKKDGKGIEDST